MIVAIVVVPHLRQVSATNSTPTLNCMSQAVYCQAAELCFQLQQNLFTRLSVSIAPSERRVYDYFGMQQPRIVPLAETDSSGTGGVDAAAAAKGLGPRIYIGGVSTAISQTMIRNHFNQFGKVLFYVPACHCLTCK